MSPIFDLRLVAVILAYCMTGVVAQQSALPSSPPWPVQKFKSAPSVQFLTLEVNKTGPTADGYLFINPSGFSHINLTAPVIMTDDSDLVWYGPHGQAFNFGTYEYQGKQVLAYWNGTIFPEPVGRGHGSITLLNSSYDTIATVTLAEHFVTVNASQMFPSNIDLHEINITPQNTVLVTANNVTQHDLSSVGGPVNGWVVDAIFYEMDIATNNILFEWHALDHLDDIPFSASVLNLGDEGFGGTTQSTAWNYVHINAVSQLNGRGGYIFSSRYLCSTIAIQRSSGDVLWVLSGIDGGDFELASNASFCYQHDVRQRCTEHDDSDKITISVFDDANSPRTLPNPTVPSSGLVLELDTVRKTAVAAARYENPNVTLYATAQGNTQYLPNGNKLLGYGFTPLLQEFDVSGTSVMTAQFGPISAGQGVPAGGVLGYRDFRSAWTGCPRTPPAVVAEKEGDGVRVYMSWNGNTEYSSWRVAAGLSVTTLDAVGSVARTGFETTLLLNQTANLVRVKAVGKGACSYTAAQMASEIVAVS